MTSTARHDRLGEVVRKPGPPITPEDLDVLSRACEAGAFGRFPSYSLSALIEGAESILGRPLPAGWELAIRGDDKVVAKRTGTVGWMLPKSVLDS